MIHYSFLIFMCLFVYLFNFIFFNETLLNKILLNINNNNYNHAKSFWDVPLFAEHQEVRANRVDARIINHESKRVITLEMSSPWITNREKKKEEKPRITHRCKL